MQGPNAFAVSGLGNDRKEDGDSEVVSKAAEIRAAFRAR